MEGANLSALEEANGMILSRANLLAVAMAEVSPHDQSLHQLHIAGDGSTAASNGTSLLAVSPMTEKPPSMPEFPDETSVPQHGVGVLPEVVGEVLKTLPRGNLAIELGYAAITKVKKGEDGTYRSVEITTTDMNQNRRLEGKLARKPFPELQPVLRAAKAKAIHRVCVDRKALLKLLQTFDGACGPGDNSAFIEFGSDPKDGILIRGFCARTGQRVIGYQTPLDTSGQWLPMSQWERSMMARGIRSPIQTKED